MNKEIISSIKRFSESRRAVILLLLTTLFCYGNTLLNNYSFDDDIIILNNQNVQQGISGIPGLLTSPYYSEGQFKVDYRPLTMIFFALETQLFGNNPVMRHLINLIVYAILVALVFFVMKDTFRLQSIHPVLPILIALVFAVHPAHTEVVASIKNRDEMMSLAFSLLALFYAARYFRADNGSWHLAVLSVLFMIFSLFSKSVSLPMSGVVLLTGLFYQYPRKGRSFLLLASVLLLISFAFFGALVLTSERPWFEIENPLAGGASLADRVSVIAQSLLFYFRFMFYPHPFRFYYGYNMVPITTLFDPLVMLSLLLHSAMLFAALTLFLKNELTGLFVLAYFFYIANYSNIIPYPGILSERALFAPSLWFIAAFMVAMFRLIHSLKDKRDWMFLATVAGIILILVPACSVLTIKRNFQWKDTLTLMASDIGNLKNSVIANYLYATELSDNARKDPGFKEKSAVLIKKHLKLAATLAPYYFEPHFKLGMIYEYDEQNRDSAFYYFKRANELKPNHNPARFQLAKQYYLMGNIAEAEQLFEKVYRELPGDTMTLYYYTQVLFNAGKQDEAMKVNGQFMRLYPGSFYPYYNYGMMYAFLREEDLAIWYFEKCFQLGYLDDQMKNFMLEYYASHNMNDKAAHLDTLNTRSVP